MEDGVATLLGGGRGAGLEVGLLGGLEVGLLGGLGDFLAFFHFFLCLRVSGTALVSGIPSFTFSLISTLA